MVTKPSRPAKAGRSTLLKPGIIVLAVTCYWAAENRPGMFDVATSGIWLMSALVVGLVAYAVIAVAMPASAIMAAYARRTAQQIQRSNSNDAAGQ